MLLGALLSFVATLLLVELPPKMGEPTSVLHGIRMYGWFVMAVVFCMLLVAVSSLCKWWLTVNGSDRNPKTKFQVFKKYAVERLVASGPILLRSCFACIAVGLVDFLWQLYPSLGKNVVATCGIYGSGPILSSVGQRPLTKTMASFARRCLFTRAGNEDLARSSEEESLEH
ncbi:hypothetical protein DFH07DRAFT_450959 [Mycena maculata]|uniref:Uncharacterized protein n=1 Tax=Mycena maculata TaxID=230809 RepID=A0AAD7NEC4_9AGAR|nr:hypothetical protein DFH07DRAFT_450959 [Mycena maculata]